MPEGLPIPAWPPVTTGDLVHLLPAALGLAVVAYSDHVLTARAFAAKQRHPLDADQELLALGAANLGPGFLQGFPIISNASDVAELRRFSRFRRSELALALATAVAVLAVGVDGEVTRLGSRGRPAA